MPFKHSSVSTVKVVKTLSDLEIELKSIRELNLTIGLVPTMGALHLGHISLIKEARKKSDFVICTLFVNPTQFNNSNDLIKYPRTEEEDIALLNANFCDLLFIPLNEEIYSSNYIFPGIELGNLDQVMEGKFRPGHFEGVCQIVYRFFTLIEPDYAFFGLKDFQQLAVINHMTSFFNLKVKIIPCETIRTEKGLALSSRNQRLSEDKKTKALILYQTLNFIKENSNKYSPKEVIFLATEKVNTSDLILEYLEIVNPVSLESLSEKWCSGARACIVAYCNEVRLIDNLQVKD